MNRRLFYCITSLLVLLSACSEEEKLPVLPTKMKHDILMQSYGVNYLYSDYGKLKAKLSTGEVQQKAEGDSNNPEHVHYFKRGVKIQFFNSDTQTEETIITSTEGKLNKQAGLADLNGNVIAIGKEGSRLECEQLFWDEKQNKIYTNGYVKISTNLRTLEGEGFESNTEMTRYRIVKAHGQVKVNNLE